MKKIKEKILDKNKVIPNFFVENKHKNSGITLIALVITIVLNSSYLAMDRMNKIEKI